MFFFRSLLIRAYTGLSPLVGLYSVWQIVTGHWLWLAPLMAWLPLWLMNVWRMYRSNLAFGDERESPALTLSLLGLALLFIAGDRSIILWWSLAGLMSLLLFTVVLSAVPKTPRDPSFNKDVLPRLIFKDHQGNDCCLGGAEPKLIVFGFGAWSPYTKMQWRELSAKASALNAPINFVFAGEIPRWALEYNSPVISCWSDPEGHAADRLGLALRGGGAGFGGLAQRPALAIIEGEQVRFWQVAQNFRVPPSLSEHQGRIEKWLN